MRRELRSVMVTRYVTPLREGGSLPAIAEADDGFLYVIKFRGAGQGVKALIAELIGSELARTAGFKVPELVFASLDEAFGRTEPDEEIQDLLKNSQGVNLGLHFLSGAITFDPVVTRPDAQFASRLVWLDAYLTNVDRTVKNTNMLWWNNEIWLIDFGASLYFHHNWDNRAGQTAKHFLQIKDHVLLPWATEMNEADNFFRNLITDDLLKEVTNLIPDAWLINTVFDESPDEIRKAYFDFLSQRIKHAATFVKTAEDARAVIV